MRPRLRNTVLQALAAVLVLALVGCGEGSKSDRLTKDQWIAQADAVCAEYESRLEALPEPNDVADVARLAREAQPIAAEGVEKLRALDPPEELEPAVAAWLELNDANVAAIDDLLAAAEAGDRQEVEVIAEKSTENERRADELAKRIGLANCAAEDE
jgi:uncharacterized protein YecT (DUF1311 family)